MFSHLISHVFAADAFTSRIQLDRNRSKEETACLKIRALDTASPVHKSDFAFS